jgi:hypothetical protein
MLGKEVENPPRFMRFPILIFLIRWKRPIEIHIYK